MEPIIQCAVCGKIKISDNWYEIVKEVIRRPPYSHSYCPVCFSTEIEKVRNLD